VNGLNLKEMEASDMLDVLHYFIEEDMNYLSAEHADGRSRTREILYQDFYGYRYPYASSNTANVSAQGGITKNFDDPIDDEEIVAFNPLKGPTKAFVPATPVDASSRKPFGAILDEPLSR
jgi:hypothetical protein